MYASTAPPPYFMKRSARVPRHPLADPFRQPLEVLVQKRVGGAKGERERLEPFPGGGDKRAKCLLNEVDVDYPLSDKHSQHLHRLGELHKSHLVSFRERAHFLTAAGRGMGGDVVHQLNKFAALEVTK